MVILKHLEKFAKYKNYFFHLQFGFKHGTGCIEASFLINEAINHFVERGTLDQRFPYKESEERDHSLASLARPTDGFSDFGRLGLVLGPLIQGKKEVARSLPVF